MNTSVKFKDYNNIQKTGTILIIVAAVMTLVKIFNVFKTSRFVENDLPNYIFGLGGLLVLLPFITRQIKGKDTCKKASIFLLVLFTGFGAIAQDYSKQIKAFTKSFSDKNTGALQPYMSDSLKFGEIPVANTPAIMKNIVKNLPKLNSIIIIESEDGKAKVAYDFVGLGKRESNIHFDTDGKIIKIELVENLIRQEAEARRQQQGVQLPTPGTLGDKYIPAKVEFAAKDGLLINANLYEVDKKNPVVLLMHQANYNRIEYADIAPKLNAMGYNCLVIDLRSGGPLAGKPNKTRARAIEKGLQPEMIDAQKDIVAAINYLNDKYNRKVIVWGSSFSSSLGLLEGYKNPKVKAIIGFSPGDYFGEASPSLTTIFSKIKKPYLVTSSREESEALKNLIGIDKPGRNQVQFIPDSKGFHGSKALWEGQEGAEEYWKAITLFLSKIK